MAKYDGLIIPRSYNEYINKSDPATLAQALRQNNVLGSTGAGTATDTTQIVTSENKEIPVQNLAAATLEKLGSAGAGTASTDTQLISKENKTTTIQNIADITLGLLGNGGNITSVSDSTFFITDGNKKVAGSAINNYVKANLVTTCSTAAGTQDKAVTISNHTLKAGDVIAVTFTNANTYGDCTLSTPTYPRLKVNGGTAYQICDNMGHSAGTGCWEAGNTVVFMFTGSKFIILNSIIRQQNKNATDGYKIYSNNYVEQWLKVTKSITITTAWGALYESPEFNLSFSADIANTIIGDDVSVISAGSNNAVLIEYAPSSHKIWLVRATTMTESASFTVGRLVTGWL